MADKVIDPRYAPPPELSITWYSDPVDVHRELWRSAAEENGMTVDELLDSSEFMGLDIDGNEISVSNQQAFEGMAEMGCWGWVDTESNTIHAWADKDADPEMVLHMLAHEIGHVTGVPDSDPLHLEPGGKWISRDYKLVMRALGIAPPRVNRSAAINDQMAKALLTARCECGSTLKQTRAGSMRAQCMVCERRYQFKRAKAASH